MGVVIYRQLFGDSHLKTIILEQLFGTAIWEKSIEDNNLGKQLEKSYLKKVI